MCRHMVGASQRLAGRQESCRDSWVCALTSKWQVGVLLGEHRGWILRMAALIKGRLSDNRPEAFAASFQTKKLRTFACFSVSPQRGINYPPSASADGPPFLSRKELRFASFPLVSFCILAFS